MKIGFIGLGNMGGSLARVVAGQKNHQILLANRSPEKAKQIAHEVGGEPVTNEVVFEQADMIFLGVKPNQFADLLQEYHAILEKRSSVLLISMAAGLTLQQLEAFIPTQHRLIRIMPNTPVAVGAGVISYAVSDKVTRQDEGLFCKLLASAGMVIRLYERQLDAATAMAGCGPAFVYLFLEALADAGVQTGLPRDLALQLANQTLLGAAALAKESGQHPAVLKDQVCSPAGSTIAGVASLEADAFRGNIIKAVAASYKRTQELGK